MGSGALTHAPSTKRPTLVIKDIRNTSLKNNGLCLRTLNYSDILPIGMGLWQLAAVNNPRSEVKIG